MMDRKEFLVINKQRAVYQIEHFEVSIDEIAGYGSGVEIEYKGDAVGLDAITEVRAFAVSLGLKEIDRHEKSITVSAMETLADYGA